jgi:hypothetical protein
MHRESVVSGPAKDATAGIARAAEPATEDAGL